jgi:hypothetical protein
VNATVKNNAMKLAAFVVMALASSGTLGCKQQVLCPPLDACGGPRDGDGNRLRDMFGNLLRPVGEWVLAENHPSCTEDLYVPANDTRLGLANLPPPGSAFPEPAVFDWCLLLTTGPGAGPAIRQKPPRFYYESGPIGVVSLKYGEDGHFTSGITRTGTFDLVFPPYCVRAFGAADGRIIDPETMGDARGDICQQLEGPIRASGLGEGSYRNTTCKKNPDDPDDDFGCICTFDVTETGGPSGSYFIQGEDTITHLPGTNFPLRADFCWEGDRLQLTGSDGTYLFDQRGVRTFDLVRACGENSQCASGNCNTTIGVCQ